MSANACFSASLTTKYLKSRPRSGTQQISVVSAGSIHTHAQQTHRHTRTMSAHSIPPLVSEASPLQLAVRSLHIHPPALLKTPGQANGSLLKPAAGTAAGGSWHTPECVILGLHNHNPLSHMMRPHAFAPSRSQRNVRAQSKGQGKEGARRHTTQLCTHTEQQQLHDSSCRAYKQDNRTQRQNIGTRHGRSTHMLDQLESGIMKAQRRHTPNTTQINKHLLRRRISSSSVTTCLLC